MCYDTQSTLITYVTQILIILKSESNKAMPLYHISVQVQFGFDSCSSFFRTPVSIEAFPTTNSLNHMWITLCCSAFSVRTTAATIIIWIILLVTTLHYLFVSMLIALRPALIEHGLFNVHNDLSACCAQKGEAGTDESAQGLTWKNSEIPHLAMTRNQTLATGFTAQRIRKLATNPHYSSPNSYFLSPTLCVPVSMCPKEVSLCVPVYMSPSLCVPLTLT